MKKLLFLIGITFSVGFYNNSAWSQEPSTKKPKPPTSFDSANVGRLIQQAEQSGNSEWLKVLYFSRRPTKIGDMPVESGWKLLEEELAKEKPASLKWFYLQNVRGIGALNLSFLSPSDGIQAFGTIFDAANLATPEESEYVVRSSINEFVSLLTGRITQLGLEKAPETREVIRKAMKAYFVSFAYTNSFAKKAPRPDWLKTFELIGTDAEFKPFVEDELKKRRFPSYEFLLVSSSALLESRDDLSRRAAIPLMLQAKAIIPKLDNGKVNLIESAQYYKLLISLYRSIGKNAEASQAAREQFNLMNQGRSSLIYELININDSKSAFQLVDEINVQSTNEEEIIAVSKVLYLYSMDTSADVNANERPVYNEDIANKLIVLLQDYLGAKRPRTSDAELEIRLRLGRVFYAKEEYVKAQKVIDEAKPLLVGALPSSETGLALGRLSQRIQEAQKLATLPVKG